MIMESKDKIRMVAVILFLMQNPLASYMLDKMKYSGDVVSGKWSADIDIWNGIKAKVNIGVDA